MYIRVIDYIINMSTVVSIKKNANWLKFSFEQHNDIEVMCSSASEANEFFETIQGDIGCELGVE